jgi:hypothetical protein
MAYREEIMFKCDICEALTDNKGYFTKDSWSEWYGEKITLDIHYCEVCEAHIKRSKMMVKFINDSVKESMSIIQDYEKKLKLQESDLLFKVMHKLDTKFIDVENRFSAVLEHLEQRLKEKGI